MDEQQYYILEAHLRIIQLFKLLIMLLSHLTIHIELNRWISLERNMGLPGSSWYRSFHHDISNLLQQKFW